MARATREPLLTYLATQRNPALQRLADFVRGLPEDDERVLTLVSLAVRDKQFVPGPGTEHALSQFAGATAEDYDAFVTQLSRVARDDALLRARQHGFLPPQRPV